jgi:streptogrisin C
MAALVNGGFSCTTGWTLFDAYGVRGASTAGHCGSVNGIVNPALGTVATNWWAGHQGQWGDISVQLDIFDATQPDDFYADPSTIRDTHAVRASTAMTQGRSVCVYGRSSNQRFCLNIEAASVSCLGLNRLVRMNGGPTIPGDSGGGWSSSNDAFGSHVGLCSGKSVFSVADFYDEAISFRVATTQ